MPILMTDFILRDNHRSFFSSWRNPRIPPAQPDQQPSPDNPQGRRSQHHLSNDSSSLARLRAEEQYAERCRLNVQNFGQSWLKPPGIPKTLYQMREERREMEEHQEALRREQLAANLAEAEAEAAAAAAANATTATATGTALQVPADALDSSMQDGEYDGAGASGERDLDDDIPDASDGGLGLSPAGSDDDSEEDSDDDESDPSIPPSSSSDAERRAEQERHLASLRAAQLGMNHDAYREAVARGGAAADAGDGLDPLDEEEMEEGTHLFEEEDLVHAGGGSQGEEGMYMGRDLDNEIPDAGDESGFMGSSSGGGGVYEHTDTEADMSSSDDEGTTADLSYSRSTQQQPPRRGQGQSRWRTSMASDGTRQSLDLSSILSRDSSIMGSSPVIQRMPGPRAGRGGSG